MKRFIAAATAAVVMTASLAMSICALAGCAGDTDEPASVEEPVLSSLAISSNPDKTVYEEGETFDSTGLVIDAVYSDGSRTSGVQYTVDTTGALSASTDDVYIKVSYSGLSINVPVSVTWIGNRDTYSVANTEANENSKLAGKTYFFLGSSVTYGAHAEGESMADFLAKADGCTVIKEAVSGTTLRDIANSSGDSYVTRLENYIDSSDKAESLDAFVCQLSTNDMYYPNTFGEVTSKETTSKDSFNKETTYGAIEYIIALVQETWKDCPIVFYTNPSVNMNVSNYGTMVEGLESIVEKWSDSGVSLLNLYEDEEFNNITDEQYALYMSDSIHPTRAGYKIWWLPKFEACLEGLLGTEAGESTDTESQPA